MVKTIFTNLKLEKENQIEISAIILTKLYVNPDNISTDSDIESNSNMIDIGQFYSSLGTDRGLSILENSIRIYPCQNHLNEFIMSNLNIDKFSITFKEWYKCNVRLWPMHVGWACEERSDCIGFDSFFYSFLSKRLRFS